MAPTAASPWMFDDPGDEIGPKSCDLWKPVIAAVNGIACGGAFYMLGEVEFIIAADHATFFDPHVTYGMTPVFEPIHVMQKMPFHEIMRISLLGNHERMSAQRAYQIGLVSEVVAADARRARSEFGFLRMWSIYPAQIQPIVNAMRPDFTEVTDAAAILLAAQNANWGPIQYQGELHDRATYRYFWAVLEKAKVTGMALPADAERKFFAG